MDEEKAVKTLTAVLVERLGSQVSQDYMYKEKLVKEAKYVYQFSEPFIMGYDQFYMKEPDSDGNKYRFGFANTERTKKQFTQIHGSLREAVDQEEKCKGANYFFAGELIKEKDRAAHFFVTPYSILGKKEIQNLRNLFYKNVPPDIMSAMHTLGIEDYTDIYKLYYTGGLDNKFLDNRSIYLKLVDSLKNLSWGIYHNIVKGKFEEFMGSSLEDLKAKLYDNVSHDFSYNDGKEVYEDPVKKIITDLEKHTLIGKYKDLPSHFLDFIFTIPYEDQNIETNKEILKRYSSHINSIRILAKEYTSGEHFQEYFNCLDFGKQEKLVDSLKTLSEKKPINDSFLWSKGFKDLNLDYLILYQNKPKEFIEYFKTRNFEEKRIIIKDVMDCEFTNEEVIDWFNQNEQDLLREVGFNG